MSQSVFSIRAKVYALVSLGLGCLPMASLAQTPCPDGQIGNTPACVTSNLHRVLLLSGGESSDHDPATANNVAYLRKLDSINGIAVDYTNVKTTPSVISATNLAKYDVLLFLNVYESASFISTAAQTLIENWYQGGKGLGCYHQCVKVETSPNTTWPWYDSVMAQPYTTYAAVNVTGPVYVDSESAAIIDSSTYKRGQSFTWSDEWYDYTASPRGMPGVKIVLTTKDSAFSGTFNSNANMKKDHVLSWTHDFQGGRYYLLGLLHPSINLSGSPVGSGVQMNMNATSEAFLNNMFLNAQKYLAGYTGCKDSTYNEYSPMATNQGANTCLTLKSGGVSILANNTLEGVQVGNFKVSIIAQGRHTVELFDLHGKMVFSSHGVGPQVYNFSEIHQPGVYYLKVVTPGMRKPLNRKLFLL